MELKSETVEQLAAALGVTVDQITFDVKALCAARLATLAQFSGAHDAVVAQGAEWVEHFGPVACQVTLEAHVTPYKDGTFAVRHLHHSSHYNGESDSGWRVWVDKRFWRGLESIGTGPKVGDTCIDGMGRRRTLANFTCTDCGFDPGPDNGHWILDNDPDANVCISCREVRRRSAVHA